MELAFILKGLENADDILLLELLNKLDQITSSRKSIDVYRKEVIDNQKLIQKSSAIIDRKDSVNSIKSWADSVEEEEEKEKEEEELRQKKLKEESEKKTKLSLADVIKSSPIPTQPVVVKSQPKMKAVKKTPIIHRCEVCREVKQKDHICTNLGFQFCEICKKRFHLFTNNEGELKAIVLDRNRSPILRENGEFVYHYIHDDDE